MSDRTQDIRLTSLMSTLRFAAFRAQETLKTKLGPMAQLVRAPPCHGGGRGFESHSGRLSIAIDKDGGIPEWPKGADCKSVSSAFGGSNPPSPTQDVIRSEKGAARRFFLYSSVWYLSLKVCCR